MDRHPTDAQVELAVAHLKNVVDAAENSNHAGEAAAWKAYRSLKPSVTKSSATHFSDPCIHCGIPHDVLLKYANR